jgi:UDP-N-acetylmuramoylalanine--D-glutamate ligase
MTQLIASSDSRVVVGLGATGLACARFLHARGLPFSVLDSRDDPPGLAALREEMPQVPVFLGQAPAAVLAAASELVVSPGIAPDDPLLQPARDAGVAVVGDIDLFMREASAPVVGITGSNAKSTVTALVGRMAATAGLEVAVGGNLGPPALDLLSEQCELYVLELSSFQLERAGSLGLAVAAVLNLSPDHLDRHGSMPLYHRAKHRIFFGCRRAVVNPDDPLTVPLVDAAVEVIEWRVGEPRLNGFGLRTIDGRETLCRGFEPLLPAAELGMVGRHNVANALAAAAIAHAADIPTAAVVAALREFRGLPHRCELIAEIDGVRYIDDSKGTNPGATEAALDGLASGRNLLLIAGGQGKGADFRSLRRAVGAHCRRVLLIGEDAPLLEAALADVAECRLLPDLESAVAEAAAGAVDGDCVLLSPACASFDMFSGFVERGQRFAALVRQLPGAAP